MQKNSTPLHVLFLECKSQLEHVFRVQVPLSSGKYNVKSFSTVLAPQQKTHKKQLFICY